jgi:hypothetical protein
VSAIAVPQEAMLKSLITAILDLSKPLALVIALFCVDTTVLSVALPTQLHKKLHCLLGIQVPILTCC